MDVTMQVTHTYNEGVYAVEMWKGKKKVTVYVTVDDVALQVHEDGTITDTPDLEEAMRWLHDNQ